MAPGRECMRLRLEAAAACAADAVIAGTAKYLVVGMSMEDAEVLWGLLEQAWLAGRSSAVHEQERLTRPRE